MKRDKFEPIDAFLLRKLTPHGRSLMRPATLKLLTEIDAKIAKSARLSLLVAGYRGEELSGVRSRLRGTKPRKAKPNGRNDPK